MKKERKKIVMEKLTGEKKDEQSVREAGGRKVRFTECEMDGATLSLPQPCVG